MERENKNPEIPSQKKDEDEPSFEKEGNRLRRFVSGESGEEMQDFSIWHTEKFLRQDPSEIINAGFKDVEEMEQAFRDAHRRTAELCLKRIREWESNPLYSVDAMDLPFLDMFHSNIYRIIFGASRPECCVRCWNETYLFLASKCRGEWRV